MSCATPEDDRKEKYELFSGPCDGFRGTSHGAAVLKVPAGSGEAHYERTDKEHDGRRVYVFKELHNADGTKLAPKSPGGVKEPDPAKAAPAPEPDPTDVRLELVPFTLWSNKDYTEFTLTDGYKAVQGDTPGLKCIETFWAHTPEEACRQRDAWFAGYATGYAFRVPDKEPMPRGVYVVATLLALGCGALGALALAGLQWFKG